MSAKHTFFRFFIIRFFISFALTGSLGMTAFAQSKASSGKSSQPSSSPGKSSSSKKTGAQSGKLDASQLEPGKLDISDLEQKYWSPKDTDFGVVQNRAYPKEQRFSGSLLYGPIVNDVFNTGYGLGLIGNYFFSERHGVEVFMINANLRNSDAVNDFKSLSGGGTIPDFGRVKQYYGVGYNFVPIYAKMSLLGRKIIYFDMAITPGLGFTSYEKVVRSSVDSPAAGNSFTYSLDITQYFFFSRNFAIRADLKNLWFKEDVVSYNTGDHVRSKTSHRMFFLMGLTYFY